MSTRFFEVGSTLGGAMTALVRKIKDGRAYWYATDSARVNGQPRVVRQRYLGTVESIEAAFDAAFEPESIDVVEFGATAAMWALAGRINFGLWVDALLGPQGTGLSVGTYLQAAAVNRAVKPRSKRGFISYYDHSVLARLVPAPPQAFTSQRFWDAMHLVDVSLLERIEEAYVKTAMDEFGIDAEALVYDATNFHTFIASTNDKAPQRAARPCQEQALRPAPGGAGPGLLERSPHPPGAHHHSRQRPRRQGLCGITAEAAVPPGGRRGGSRLRDRRL